MGDVTGCPLYYPSAGWPFKVLILKDSRLGTGAGFGSKVPFVASRSVPLVASCCPDGSSSYSSEDVPSSDDDPVAGDARSISFDGPGSKDFQGLPQSGPWLAPNSSLAFLWI